MPRAALYVTDPLPAGAKEILAGFEVFEAPDEGVPLERCQGLVCWPSRAKRELLQKMGSLRVIQTFSAGVDGMDFRSLPSGVEVFSNAGAFTESVGEHAWGLLLGVAKGVQLRNQKTTPRTLRGKTLVVVGCGAIGSEVARLSRSLGMRTVGLSRSFRSPEFFDERLPLDDLGEAAGWADAIVVTLPLTNGTRGAIDYGVHSGTKHTVIVVNVGRGDTVDEGGLLRWLKERPESRFATDVYWKKDGKESFSTPAWELPNFAGTLHNSGLPLGADLARAKEAAAMNIRRYFEEGSALNRVDVAEYR